MYNKTGLEILSFRTYLGQKLTTKDYFILENKSEYINFLKTKQ